MRSLRMRSRTTFYITGAVLLAAGGLLAASWGHVRDATSEEVAIITSKSLDKSQVKAEEVAKSVVHHVLNDRAVLDEASKFVGRLAAKDWTRDAVADLAKWLVADPGVQASVLQMLQAVVNRWVMFHFWRMCCVEMMCTMEGLCYAIVKFICKRRAYVHACALENPMVLLRIMYMSLLRGA